MQRTLFCEPLEDRRLLAVVTSAADSGPGTLREAIAGMDLTITFDVATMGTSTINLTSGALVVDRNVSIDGDDGLGGRVTINGGGLDRAFTMTDYVYYSLASQTLSNLIITGGQANNGGGIRNEEDLTLTNVDVTNNSAAMSGGGIFNVGILNLQNSTIANNNATQGGGISNSGSFSLSSATITGNTSGGDGGGVSNSGNSDISFSTISANSASGQGGGVSNTGTLDILNSTISGNSAVGYGGGISDFGSLNLERNSIEFNQAAAGGGLFMDSCVTSDHLDNTFEGNRAILTPSLLQSGKGGAIALHGGFLELKQNTISGNTGEAGGGGIHANHLNTNCDQTLTITYSTIAFNTVTRSLGKGGGIWLEGSSVLSMNTSIVAQNRLLGFTTDLSTDISKDSAASVSVDYSLIGNVAGSGIPLGGTNKTGLLNAPPGVLDPQLSSLSNWGGPTKTHALNQNSPAINMGNPSPSPPTGFDQRGPIFGRILNQRIDMGAFEVGPDCDFDNNGNYNIADLDILTKESCIWQLRHRA